MDNQEPQNQQPVNPTTVPGKGMGIAAMVLGIVGIVFCCVYYISFPCSVVGIILAAIAKKKAKEAGMKNGMATAGLVCSIIAIAWEILWIAFVAALVGYAGTVGTFSTAMIIL